MKVIHGKQNNVAAARALLRAAERKLAAVVQHDPELSSIVDALVVDLAKLYETDVNDIRQHVNLGVQVSLGFDYSLDFVKDRFKSNPLVTQVQHDAASYKKQAKYAEYKATRDKLMNSGFFKTLVLIGKVLRG